jgi:hypothetical protein
MRRNRFVAIGQFEDMIPALIQCSRGEQSNGVLVFHHQNGLIASFRRPGFFSLQHRSSV